MLALSPLAQVDRIVGRTRHSLESHTTLLLTVRCNSCDRYP